MGTFRVALIAEYDIHYFVDGSRLIGSAINIVDRNGTGESPGHELIPMDVVPINEEASGSAINNGINGLGLLSVCGDNLNLNV